MTKADGVCSVEVRCVSFGSASAMIKDATDYAVQRDWKIAVAVVDTSGNIVAAGRMDGVASPIMEYALDKAFTAGTHSKSTREFFERMSESPELALGLANRNRVITWEGGLPIVENNLMIGGLGVSGAAGNEDAECASYALKKQGLM